MNTTAYNWLAATAICILLGAAGPMLDAIDVWRAAMAASDARQAAAVQELAEADYTRWAQDVCGANTGWKVRTDGARVCTNKHGRSTGVVLAGANP